MDKKNRVKEKLTVAALQLNSGDDVHHNLNQVQNLVGEMNKLPDILVLPEVFNFRSFGNHEAPYSESLNGPSIECLKALAIEKKNAHYWREYNRNQYKSKSFQYNRCD